MLSGHLLPKHPDTVPAVSGQHSYLIRPKAGTSCMEFNMDYSVVLSPPSI